MVDKKHHILIAEDEKPMAKALGTKLEHAGYEVTTTFNGADALAAIEKGDVDVIILDLVMPRLDGWQVLEKLKDAGNAVPIIVASNLSQTEDEKRAKELGAKDFFVKSNVPITELVDRISSLVG